MNTPPFLSCVQKKFSIIIIYTPKSKRNYGDITMIVSHIDKYWPRFIVQVSGVTGISIDPEPSDLFDLESPETRGRERRKRNHKLDPPSLQRETNDSKPE